MFVLALAVSACADFQPTAPPEPGATGVIQFSAAPTWGTTTDMEGLLGPPTPVLAQYGSGFVQQVSAQLSDAAALERIFKRWLSTIVSVTVNPASWDLDLYSALRYYQAWLSLAQLHVPNYDTVFQPEIDAFKQAIAGKLMLAIDGNLNMCRTSQDLAALANVIFWFGQAEQLGLPGASYWSLTGGGLQQRIGQSCVEVVVLSIQFPNPVAAGQSFTLRTTSAVRFVGQTTTQTAAFHMTVVLNPAGVLLPDGFTDAAGLYEIPASFPSAGQHRVFALACLVLPDRTSATEYVCGDRTETADVVNPPPPPPPPSNCSGTLTSSTVQVATVAALNAVSTYDVIDGNLFVQANDSLVNVSFPCLRTVTGVLGISNNRQMTQIAFPLLSDVGRTITLVTNPILTAASFPNLQRVGAVGSVVGTLPGAFAVNNNPALTTLDIGAVTIFRNAPSQLGGLQLMQPLGLSTLSGLSTAISVDTLFFTLPAAGQPGLTKAQFQTYKSNAPAVLAVCELPAGAGGIRVCL